MKSVQAAGTEKKNTLSLKAPKTGGRWHYNKKETHDTPKGKMNSTDTSLCNGLANQASNWKEPEDQIS